MEDTVRGGGWDTKAPFSRETMYPKTASEASESRGKRLALHCSLATARIDQLDQTAVVLDRQLQTELYMSPWVLTLGIEEGVDHGDDDRGDGEEGRRQRSVPAELIPYGAGAFGLKVHGKIRMSPKLQRRQGVLIVGAVSPCGARTRNRLLDGHATTQISLADNDRPTCGAW